MENASKALLMIGGILLVILILGVLIFAWNKYSEFYNKEDDIMNISDLTEFNKQFTTFERDDLAGYELISLANKVADYNFRYSNLTDTAGYNPITLKVTLTEAKEKIWYNEGTEYSQHLFTNGTITQSLTKNEISSKITTALGIAQVYNASENVAAQLAKSINLLILSDDQIEYYKNVKKMNETEIYTSALRKYTSITGVSAFSGTSVKDQYNQMVSLLKNTANIYKYYEYYQFKKGIFECTEILYDNVTGRVSQINCKFTGEIK